MVPLLFMKSAAIISDRCEAAGHIQQAALFGMGFYENTGDSLR